MAQPNRSTFFVSVAAAAAVAVAVAGLVVLTAPVQNTSSFVLLPLLFCALEAHVSFFPLSPLVRARPKLHRRDGVPKKLIF